MMNRMGLTAREAQICCLLFDGMTMRQVFATLGTVQGTVNTTAHPFTASRYPEQDQVCKAA
jgi:DNA-binding CsgD family transcriptional regulator